MSARAIPLWGEYRVFAPTRAGRDAMLRFLAGVAGAEGVDEALQALREAAHGRVAIAFEDGGLLQWLDAWQNAILPADYHAREAVRQAERRARGLFAAFGRDPDSLAGRPIGELSLLEARLVGFVKAMLLEPELLVLDCLFERLGSDECREVRRWIDYWRARYPLRRVLYVGLAEPAEGLLAGFAPLEAVLAKEAA